MTEPGDGHKQLFENPAVASLILERSRDPFVAIDSSGNVTFWNKEAENLFGYDKNSAVGKDMGSLIIPPSQREAHWRGLRHYQSTGEGPIIDRRIQVKAIDKDGNEFPIELTVFPIDPQTPYAFGAFVQDIGPKSQVIAQQQAARAEEQDGDSDPYIGMLVGERYRIVAMIGSGGMSSVYKGIHEAIHRSVAIKILHSKTLQDPTSYKRFEHEALALSALSHPNIITAFDFGKTDSGVPYMVMDFVEGLSLSEILDANARVSAKRAVNIGIQICNALALAHSKGVVHRDLKPHNVMITMVNDGEDLIKVVDFGLAVFLPTFNMPMQKLTAKGEFFGSAQYMSPEQCKGQAVDFRSDIYALGCVLHEAVVGLAPFRGENVLDTMTKHKTEPPPSLVSLRPDLKFPDGLQQVISRCLMKDPAERYASMEAMRQDLRQISV